MTVQVKKDFTTADAIVQELVDVGVDVVFGISSIHNLPIYDAISRNGTIHLVTARGESGAVNMADGYARATGKLGVVITSTGTGAGNAAGALVEAWSAGTAMLHITGEVPSSYLGLGKGSVHECKDQLSMMEASSKKAYHLRNPSQAVPFVRKAILEAMAAPSGPITLEIPIDFQSVNVPRSNIMKFESAFKDSLEILVPPKDFTEVVDKITNSKRPIIWAGGGAIKAGASEEIKILAEKIGAGVITSQLGRGSIPEDHPLCIGHFSAFEEVAKFISDSDLLISIGTTFRGNETGIWKLVIPDEHIGINVDLSSFNLNYPVTYGLVGDAKTTLRGLIDALSQQEISEKAEYIEEIKEVRVKVRTTLREKLGPYEKFNDYMQSVLPKDVILVRDVTVPATSWGGRLFEVYHPRSSIHAAGGGIGQGLPMAIGTQIGCRDRLTVLMVGDGGFMVNLGELATAAEEKLPMVIILFDDAGYGILRNIQDQRYKRRAAVDLLSPDFVALGKSIGFESSKVTSSDEFFNELETAVVREKPSLIVVDMDKVGPMNEPFMGPISPGKSSK